VSAESDRLADQIADLEERAQAFDDAASPLSTLLEAVNDNNSVLWDLDPWLTCNNVNQALSTADERSKVLWAEVAELEKRYEALCDEDDD